MAETFLKQELQLQQRIVNSLYPIAVRFHANLPKCFVQFKDYSSSSFWEETLSLKDACTVPVKSAALSKVIADQPIPLCCSLYYYEVNVSTKSHCGSLMVGFSIDETDKPKHHRCSKFIGYHSNTGRIYLDDSTLVVDEKKAFGPSFGAGDVIGCGVNFVSNSIFFTKNGIFVNGSNAPHKLANAVMFPCVIMASPATSLVANFGQRDFVFAIGQFLAQERCNTVAQVVQRKLTADLANVEMQSLVFDYLLRHGYLATASAMVRPSPPTSTTPAPAVTAAATVVHAVCSDFSSSTSEVRTIAKDDPNSKANYPLPQFNSFQKQESIESPMTKAEVAPTTALSILPKPALREENWKYGSDEWWPETLQAANQRIRLANLIRQGQYLQAISQLVHDYTDVVEAMPSIIFMLRCRYFIELLLTNQPLPEGDAVEETTTASAVTITKATSAPPNPDCKKGSKTGGCGNFKCSQPLSQPECSFCVSGRSGSCFRQSAIHRKCKEININTNGTIQDREDDENFNFEHVLQDNGTAVVLQAPRCFQNGVSPLTKVKKKAAQNLFKSCSMQSVEQTPDSPISNGFVLLNNYDPPEPPLQLSPNAKETLLQESRAASLDLHSVVNLGRELRDKAQELQKKNAISITQIALLQDAVGLMAYENPYESPFADLVHPKHRKTLADSVNNAILMNLGKARYSLLEMKLGLLEKTILDGQWGSRKVLSAADAKPLRKQRNQTSNSSAGSTLTPSHTVSTFVNLPSTVGVFATDASPLSRTGGSSSSGLQPHYRGHRRHHRSDTSSLVVTSTVATPSSGLRAFNTLYMLPSLPASTASIRLRSSSTGRRLRSTILPSSRDIGEEGLQEVVVSGGGGVDYTEDLTEHDEAGTVAVGTTTDEVEEIPMVFQENEGIRVDRHELTLPLLPPQRSDVRVGGSEVAGFFHPVLFVPPPSTH